MAEETNGNGLLGIHEQLQKLNHAMFDEDGKVESLKGRVFVVESEVKWHSKEIGDMKEDIKNILEDTKWLRRTITTTIIGTLSTGIIGGAIALIYTIIGK